jgi:hypothetical protein
MKLPENEQEFLFIKLESYTEKKPEMLSNEIAAVFDTNIVYSVADLAANGGIWPVLSVLVKTEAKRIAFFSQNDPSTLVHKLNEQIITPDKLTDGYCPDIDYTLGFLRAQGGSNSIVVSVDGEVSLYSIILSVCMMIL